MSHETTAGDEAGGGPQCDERLPEASAPTTDDPTVGDPAIPDEEDGVVDSWPEDEEE